MSITPPITVWSSRRGKRLLTKQHLTAIASVFKDYPHFQKCSTCRRLIVEDVGYFVAEALETAYD